MSSVPTRNPFRPLNGDTNLAISPKTPVKTKRGRENSENSNVNVEAKNKKLAIQTRCDKKISSISVTITTNTSIVSTPHCSCVSPSPSSPKTARTISLFSLTSEAIFQALCAISKDETACVVLTPRAGDDSGNVQIRVIQEDQATQDQLCTLTQHLCENIMKPAKCKKIVENLIQTYGLSKRLSCFNQENLDGMLAELLSWVIHKVGDSNLRITNKSMFDKLKSSYGWKVNILKKSIETLFENLAKASGHTGEFDTSVSLGKQELLIIIQRLIDGSSQIGNIIAHKNIIKLFL